MSYAEKQSQWTTDILKETIFRELEELKKDVDRRFTAQQKEVETAFAAAKEAVNQSSVNAKEAVLKSEVGVEKRSDAVYVTLSKLGDALAAVMPRAEAEQRFNALSDKIDELKSSRDETAGGKKVSDLTMGKVIAVVGVSVSLLGFVISSIIVIANLIFG